MLLQSINVILQNLKNLKKLFKEPRGRAVLLGFLTLLLSTQVPFPNKISCFVSTYVSSDNSFPSVRQEPSFGPWKWSLFLQQMVTLVGFFFTETDILTTQGTQGPAACQWTRPSGRNWDPFVPGLLLMQTTGQNAPTR